MDDCVSFSLPASWEKLRSQQEEKVINVLMALPLESGVAESVTVVESSLMDDLMQGHPQVIQQLLHA